MLLKSIVYPSKINIGRARHGTVLVQALVMLPSALGGHTAGPVPQVFWLFFCLSSPNQLFFPLLLWK